MFKNQNILMFVGFSIIGSCVLFALRFIIKVGLHSFRNTLFKSEIISKPVTCLKYKS